MYVSWKPESDVIYHLPEPKSIKLRHRKPLAIAVRNDRLQKRYSELLASLKGDGRAVVGSLGSVRNRPASLEQDKSR